RASLEERHHSGMARLLDSAKFEQELLEARYLKKVRYLMKGQYVSLLLDDTLTKREGKHVVEAQFHHDHCSGGYIRGHQFVTAMIHTSVLCLPLFPKLYSSSTVSKIEMAREWIDELWNTIPIDVVLFDSWYSDKKLINKCLAKGIKVVCAIKTNRNICLEKWDWQSLSTFSQNMDWKTATNYFIEDKQYQIKDYEVKLKSIPLVKLLVSHEWQETQNIWSKHFHLISTNAQDSPVQIIRQYRLRWHIEVFHRDIKQNLEFDHAIVRKKEGIVRHAIFVALAYTILQLYMFQHGLQMTIGECITHIQDKGMNDFVREIVEIEDKTERIKYFEEAFIRKSAKV
ncbi:MAG: transposase, partial [Candidatus Nanoarchaeia archaeon]